MSYENKEKFLEKVKIIVPSEECGTYNFFAKTLQYLQFEKHNMGLTTNLKHRIDIKQGANS
jgi:hypothetical protein